MLDQELEVSVRARRWSVVVDPLLALTSPLGAQLVQRLGAVADLWVVRSFWQVLDSSEFYRHDALAFWPDAVRRKLPPHTADAIADALDLWEGARAHADFAQGHLSWISDSLTESCLPEGAPADLIARYEALHQSLGARSDLHHEATETAGFFGAMDALALTAALGPVRLLTLALDDPRSCLARACELLQVPLECAPDRPTGLAAIERDRFRELLVQAGASALTWAGPPLAIVHLALQRAVVAEAEAIAFEESSVGRTLAVESDDEACAAPGHDPWIGARAFFQDA